MKKAHFQSHIDGRKISLRTDLAVEIQETLGTDIHMVLDEWTPFPATYQGPKDSMQRSMHWAKRSRQAKTQPELWQFGMFQGSMYEDLRQESVDGLREIDFECYSIGSLSVGEPKPDMRHINF